jgi:hypothetical protein
MKIREKAADLIQDILPERPYFGPPLPQAFHVTWPRAMPKFMKPGFVFSEKVAVLEDKIDRFVRG